MRLRNSDGLKVLTLSKQHIMSVTLSREAVQRVESCLQFDFPLRLSWNLGSDKTENERKCTGDWLEMDRPTERMSSLKGSQCGNHREKAACNVWSVWGS